MVALQVISYLLIELHCGYDMPWMIHNIAPRGWMNGPPRHDYHHVRGDRCFSKFFTWLDTLMGTGPTEDWRQASVAAEKGPAQTCFDKVK